MLSTRPAAKALLALLVLSGLAGLGAWLWVRRGQVAVAWEHEISSRGARLGDAPRALTVSRAGLAFLLGDKLYRFDASGAKRELKSPALDAFDEGSLSVQGDLALAFYKKVNDVASELHVTRIAPDGSTKFDLALGELRDDTCGTGRLPVAVATHGSVTWISARPAGVATVLLALEENGRELLRVDPCACAPSCACVVERLDAHEGGVVVTTSAFDEQHARHIWLDSAGKVAREGRASASSHAAFDGQGSFYWLARTPFPACPRLPDDGTQRLVRVGPTGCSFGPPVPAELLVNANILGVGVTGAHVYLATDDPRLPLWRRGPSGSEDNAFRAVIHRFDREGRLLSTRGLAHDRAFATAGSPLRRMLHVVDDEQLIFSLLRQLPPGDEGARTRARDWTVFGVRPGP
jgi:hypothetical protein